MSIERLTFREAVSVPDLEERFALARRAQQIRSDAVLAKNTLEHWNRAHPEEAPLDTAFEDAVIAWCDGEGPLPTLPAQQQSNP